MPLNKATLTALHGSIENWEGIVAYTTGNTEMSDLVELHTWERPDDDPLHCERDLDLTPYERQELRVVEYLESIDEGLGFQDDPIGFLITSHEQNRRDLNGGVRLLLDAGTIMIDQAKKISEGKQASALLNQSLEQTVERSAATQRANELLSAARDLAQAEAALIKHNWTVFTQSAIAAEKEWIRLRDGGAVARDALFVDGEFTAHSGQILRYKIECDALTTQDIATIAAEIARYMTFSAIVGVPTGGLRLADALAPYATPNDGPLLIVEDVLTTGSSMETVRAAQGNPKNCVGIVIFARGPCPTWVRPFLDVVFPDRRPSYEDFLHAIKLEQGCVSVSEIGPCIERHCPCARAARAAADLFLERRRPQNGRPARTPLTEQQKVDEAEQALLEKVQQIAAHYGCTASELWHSAVNVQGDTRTYFPSVSVKFPGDMDWDRVGRVAAEIVNRVRVSRVLMEVTPLPTDETRAAAEDQPTDAPYRTQENPPPDIGV